MRQIIGPNQIQIREIEWSEVVVDTVEVSPVVAAAAAVGSEEEVVEEVEAQRRTTSYRAEGLEVATMHRTALPPRRVVL